MKISDLVFAPIPTKRRFVNVTGMRFSRLVVVGFCGSYYEGTQVRHLWWCRCDCGNIIKARNDHLKNSNTRSCGCLQRDFIANEKLKHGHCKGRKVTKIYGVYRSMIDRCHNPNANAFAYYGARGITVCDRWRESVFNFIADMGDRPKGGTIDRINNDGPYCKENCRWITQQEQMKNTRQNNYVTYQGETLCLMDWAKRFKIPYTTLRYRIASGWPLEKAFVSKIT